jgi:hypothetical protein
MRFLQLENGNLIKNALSKIKSLCHADSKHIFESNIVRVLSILKSSAYFSVCFDFMQCLRHENGNLKKNA